MPGSSFGSLFAVHTFGESHGPAVGCVVDGCPAGVPLDVERIATALARRRPGQSALTTPRAERDHPELLSGVFDGRTLGTPIAVVVRNADTRSRDYSDLVDTWRPGHGDATWTLRYGHRDHRGGGRASARETVGRVAAGAIAEATLEAIADARGEPRPRVLAWVQQVGDVVADGPAPADIVPPQQREATDRRQAGVDVFALSRASIDAHPTRCPDPATAARMQRAIEAARDAGDTLGGVVRAVVLAPPPGLGDPVFDKLTATLAAGLTSLPAVRAVAFGTGHAAAGMRGSEHNDALIARVGGGVESATNHAGGMLGGISTGMPIVVDVTFKPVSSIRKAQSTIRADGETTEVRISGRHDPCVLPRAVPMVEAMILLTLAEHSLRPAGLRAAAGPGSKPEVDR